MRQKKFFILTILFAIFFAYITNIEQIPKNITVSVAPEIEVIPGGDCIGVKVYSKGVLIVGESEVQLENGSWSKPYKEGTFKPGDILLKINDYEIEEAVEISNIINNIGEKNILLTCMRDGNLFETEIIPLKCSEDGKYKIGLWVRDGAMGVGTLTFYLPDYSSYAALGHGISDEDSKSLIELESGDIYGANVISINKGIAKQPGEIRGILDEEKELGTIEKNSNVGIMGKYESLSNNISTRERIFVASKNEVTVGPAKIRCTVDSSQEVKEYDIEIQRVSTSGFFETKGMVIKVTDEELISKTGGIIQGMSGSPIIQNGKLVGAVTHVYVSDPTKGYGIFAETMIEKMGNI